MLIFLKLGGSLITDKAKPHSVRLSTMERVLTEIKDASRADPGMQLLIGHGSGSFGHTPAKKYSTRSGVYTEKDWFGFTQVFTEARALDRIFTELLISSGIAFQSFPPCVCLTTSRRKPLHYDLEALRTSFQHHGNAVIYGDVIFDLDLHASILSTEELFLWLAPLLRPERILLAGLDAGVFEDYPKCNLLTPRISKSQKLGAGVNSSSQVDVTGGMLEKVRCMQQCCQLVPGMTASIFSGDAPGNVYKALLGEELGTLIY